jgi:hypothetical protein
MVSSCYSLEVYLQAYDKAVMPCRDRTEWTKTNGPDVLPPYYEKKVGRPKRCRRKDPEENEIGTRVSKHGVKMHCSYCRSPNHTKRNCAQYKSDLEQGVAFPPTEEVPADEVLVVEVDIDEVPVAEVGGDEVPTDNDQVQTEKEEVPADEVPAPEVGGDQVQTEKDQVPAEQVLGKRKKKPSRKKIEQQAAEAEYEARRKKAKKN